MEELFAAVNDGLWAYFLIPFVAALGLYFTVRGKAAQLRLFPEMLRAVTGKSAPVEGGKPISSFGAFTLSAAARVGTGNIAGVATAITLGGAGAVFWMWVMAFIGAASAFIEATLAQLYKVRDGGAFRGGPAYYMQRGLGARWLGIIFAVTITLTFGLAFSSVQANTISGVISEAVGGADSVTTTAVVGLVLASLTGLVVFGGVRRLVSVTMFLVPIMAIIYLALGLVVVVIHFEMIPVVLADIVGQAFGFGEIVGGGVGAAIMQGVRRGMFSNEAGLGSAPNAAATASVSHPVKQGLVQSLGVFFDTILICSMTAFIILTSNPKLLGKDAEGANLTLDALQGTLGGWAGSVLTLVVFLLAFSSILGNYYYGQTNVEFITGGRGLTVYRGALILVVFLGCVGSFGVVWALADVFMALLALINLVALAPLAGLPTPGGLCPAAQGGPRPGLHPGPDRRSRRRGVLGTRHGDQAGRLIFPVRTAGARTRQPYKIFDGRLR